MIFGRTFSWYFKVVQTPFSIVASWVLFSEILGKTPLIGWLFFLMVFPITLILKLGGYGYVGYQTVKKYQGTNLQALVSGGIFGLGVGLVLATVSIFKTWSTPGFLKFFWEPFNLMTIIFSESITGLVLGFIAGVLAENQLKRKK